MAVDFIRLPFPKTPYGICLYGVFMLKTQLRHSKHGILFCSSFGLHYLCIPIIGIRTHYGYMLIARVCMSLV